MRTLLIEQLAIIDFVGPDYLHLNEGGGPAADTTNSRAAAPGVGSGGNNPKKGTRFSHLSNTELHYAARDRFHNLARMEHEGSTALYHSGPGTSRHPNPGQTLSTTREQEMSMAKELRQEFANRKGGLEHFNKLKDKVAADWAKKPHEKSMYQQGDTSSGSSKGGSKKDLGAEINAKISKAMSAPVKSTNYRIPKNEVPFLTGAARRLYKSGMLKSE